MRCIDADVLINKYGDCYTEEATEEGCIGTTIKGIVNSIPTIESERKNGKWIYGEHDITLCDGYKCDKCGFFVPWDYQHKFIDFIKDYNFCPSCGSCMMGGAEVMQESFKIAHKSIAIVNDNPMISFDTKIELDNESIEKIADSVASKMQKILKRRRGWVRR